MLDFQGSWNEKLPLIEFAYNNSYHDSIKMAPYEALYGRKFRSPIHWHKTSERNFLGSDEVDQITEDIRRIRQRLQTSVDRQRKYADRRRRPLVFEVGDNVLLKVAPLRGAMRFGKKGKLSPRFVGPFEIIERIREVAYRLALPPALSKVHDVFHVSLLRKYMRDPSHVISYEQLSVDPQLVYEEKPVMILAERKKC